MENPQTPPSSTPIRALIAGFFIGLIIAGLQSLRTHPEWRAAFLRETQRTPATHQEIQASTPEPSSLSPQDPPR